MKSSNAIRGFTLIELLVVISIIALLLSILMPSLNKVKNNARSLVCQSNIRQLSLAWTAYTAANKGKIVGGCVGISGSDPTLPDYLWSAWVEIPQDENGVLIPLNGGSWPDTTLANKERGIKKGLLYPYVDTLEVYHCGGDPRLKNNHGMQPARRSYSIGAGMNVPNIYTKTVKKIDQLRKPSDRYVFVEATDPRGWNQGFWDIYAESRVRVQWWNVVAGWHRERSNWGFADGHAETQRWQDKRTIAIANESDYVTQMAMRGSASKNNNDLLWIFDRREYQR